MARKPIDEETNPTPDQARKAIAPEDDTTLEQNETPAEQAPEPTEERSSELDDEAEGGLRLQGAVTPVAYSFSVTGYVANGRDEDVLELWRQIVALADKAGYPVQGYLTGEVASYLVEGVPVPAVVIHESATEAREAGAKMRRW